jgi:release factor glutamine methyltransferase
MREAASPVDVTSVAATLRSAGSVFAEEEARLLISEAETPDRLSELVARRMSGLPLEQVLGWAEFCGLRIAVEPGVFVPRQRTSFLVRLAADVAVPGDVVVDLCCGSGAIGAAIAAAAPGVKVFAADIDPRAVACARRNLPPHRVFEGDLFEALPRSLAGRIDVLVANAPYVPTDAIGLMPPEARLYEATVALDGGADGLSVQRRLLQSASGWLARGGVVLVETSERQAPWTSEIFAESGLSAAIRHSEELDSTVVIGHAIPVSG